MLFFYIIVLGDYMKKLNNRGFTLVEVLAVIVIIAIIGGIAIPNVLSSINSSKAASRKIMIKNIKTAAQQLYEEVDFLKEDNTLKDGGRIIEINDSSITISLQALVSNGFLSITGEESKKLIDPETREDIGSCKIKITKNVDDNYKVKYEFSNESSDVKCPNYD